MSKRIILVLAGAAVASTMLGSMVARASDGVSGDAIRGGQLYDKWWVPAGVEAPAGDHPLYPLDGPKAGTSTHRCKECHGWDYKGASGAYGKGSSHYTGIPGVLGTTKTAQELFYLLKRSTRSEPNGHGYGGLGMSNTDIWDVVAFLQSRVIDTDLYIDEAGAIQGDVVAGEIGYMSTGRCFACHGDAGNNINFGDPDDPEWVGTIGADNPWELLHKVRFGQPGIPMPPWLATEEGTDQGAADVSKFCQTLPAAPCKGDIDKNGAIDVDDLMDLLLRWGTCP